ncbi:PAC2 family protein [Candidatus Woesearchaeota archaeon]|nr:PAC2 family protein [Candidatus Woesearchaeota archaeon]
MTKWVLTQVPKQLPKLRNPVLVEGLPGIGNVGKLAVDFIIEELKAEKLYDLFSYALPNSVFVTEDNLVELPNIAVYWKKGKKDLLFLAGDVQPIDEISAYEFSDYILDIHSQFAGSEIVTLGGIGLPHIPKKPKVYCTGNSKEIIRAYSGHPNVESSLYGVVGPIIGVSGLLLGLSKRRNISAVSLLAETYARPMYLGMRGAREIVKVLDKQFSLGIDINSIDREIAEVEQEMGEGKPTSAALRKLQRKMGSDVNYIG